MFTQELHESYASDRGTFVPVMTRKKKKRRLKNLFLEFWSSRKYNIKIQEGKSRHIRV